MTHTPQYDWPRTSKRMHIKTEYEQCIVSGMHLACTETASFHPVRFRACLAIRVRRAQQISAQGAWRLSVAENLIAQRQESRVRFFSHATITLRILHKTSVNPVMSVLAVITRTVGR